MTGAGLKLGVYFGESLMVGRRLAGDALMDCFERHELEVAALYRGIEGFGLGRRIHTERFPDISTDLPLVAEAIDTRERIEAVLGEIDSIIDRGLVTLEHSHLAVGEDVRTADFPEGVGSAGRLTIYCGRGERTRGTPSYRAVVDLLREHGASGATVLLGVDGMHRGGRRRAALLRRNADVPLAIVAVGAPDVLARPSPRCRACCGRRSPASSGSPSSSTTASRSSRCRWSPIQTTSRRCGWPYGCTPGRPLISTAGRSTPR